MADMSAGMTDADELQIIAESLAQMPQGRHTAARLIEIARRVRQMEQVMSELRDERARRGPKVTDAHALDGARPQDV